MTDPAFNDRSSVAALLATRRSGKPRDMVAPGPDEATLRHILQAAIRVPDHGKLAPWRFVVVPPDRREDFAALLDRAYRAERPQAPAADLDGVRQFALQAPALVVALSQPVQPSKIPLWEQELSAGAACMNLLTAAHGHGFVAGWLTGWAAESAMVRDAFGGNGARIAGFIFIGSAGRPLEERPRPAFDEVVRVWPGLSQG
jgi:nitroreductase